MSKEQKTVHLGKILREEFLIPFNITNYRLAKDLKISAGKVSNIVNEKCGVSLNIAAKLALYFNATVEFWLIEKYIYQFCQRVL